MTDQPRVCVPKTLPPSRLEEAAENAVKERLGNLPEPSMLADAVNKLSVLTDRLIPGDELHAQAGVMLTKKIWPVGRVLTIGWFRGEYTEDDKLRARIRDLINGVERYANIRARFIGFDNVHEADVRIADRDDGSWSYVGTDVLSIPRDEPTLNLGWLEHDMDADELRRVVIHEYGGHTIGMEHEQGHPHNDREYDREYIYDHFQRTQGWGRAETDWQFFRLLSARASTFDGYDPDSVMHYPVPREFLLDASQEIGWNDRYSDGDRAFLRRVYPYPNREAA